MKCKNSHWMVCYAVYVVWDMYERVYINSLLCNSSSSTSSHCLSAIMAQWGDGKQSARVSKLEGMKYEAQQHYQRAANVYHEILQSDPTHVGAYKRLICVEYAQGHYTNAAIQLNEYLKLNPLDEHAWLLLYQCYLYTLQYELAKFCIEECISLCPENYLYHTLYAEVREQCSYGRQSQ